MKQVDVTVQMWTVTDAVMLRPDSIFYPFPQMLAVDGFHLAEFLS